MFLDSTKYKNNTRTVTGTPTIYPNDVVLLCDTSAAPVVINLLEIPNDYWQVNYKMYIVDSANNAATNNITINAGTGQTIDNTSSKVLSTNSGTLIIQISSNSAFSTTGSPSTATGSVTSVSFVHANGINGSVANPTTTPAITLNLDNSGIAAGTYTYATVTYDARGIATSASSGTTPLTQLVTKYTVFVKKNGNDSTGVCEREDLPFLTILAARNAALAFYPSRSPILRVRIQVESGFYSDIIYVDDFIDYDLGNSNVTGSTAGIPTIYAPPTNTYTPTSDGIPNCVIYGVATISNTFANTATIETRGTDLRMVLFCNCIFGEEYEAILMRTSNLLIYANLINMNIPANSLRQCINLATNNTFSQTPTLEINGAKVYTLQTGSTNSIVEIYNGELGSNLNSNNSHLTFVNCQLGSWATNRAAIECPNPNSGTSGSRGYAKIVLSNTIIFSNAAFNISAGFFTGCVNDYYYDSDRGALSVYVYGAYSNRLYSLTNPLSGMYISNIVVDSNVEFNNGVTI